jgi:hypothetical protein
MLRLGSILIALLFAPAIAHAQAQPGPIQIQPHIEQGPVIQMPGQPQNPPIQLPPLQQPPIHVEHAPTQGGPGSLKCNDASLTNSCGYETADKLGVYKLDLHCDQGFYDPIWGGTCWKCPDDDGSGGWIRSANDVQNDDACWRVPKEKTGPAKKVKSTSWAWECSSGTFWDGYDLGACWQCPDDLPRRTANPVYSGSACATSLNQTAAAVFLKFNGCPSLEQALADKTLALKGKRMPGRPFLDIGAGWAQGQASGLCYACPTIDSDGNFLITDRTASAVTSNQACAIRFKWAPPYFAEPGISGLGAVALIQDQKILDPTGFTIDLYAQAGANKIPAASVKEWVATGWAEVAAHPLASNELRTAIYTRLVAAANTAPSARTPAQAAAVAAMEKYIEDKRVFIAQQALEMYDAWKTATDQYQSSLKESQVGQLFDYGTVPLDFVGLSSAILTPVGAIAATGAGLTGALVGVSKFADAANFIRQGTDTKLVNANALFKQLSSGKFFENAFQGIRGATAVLSGATVIEIGFAVLSSIAIDQFEAIVNTRPRLQAAVVTAQQPVSLATLVSTGDGQDLLKWYFAKAVEDALPQREDPTILALAQAAKAKAAATGYALPQ